MNSQRGGSHITKDTKVTVGVIVAVASVIFLPAVGTYLTMSSTLNDVKLEIATGFSRLTTEVKHNTSQLQALSGRMQAYEAMRIELAELKARVLSLEKPK